MCIVIEIGSELHVNKYLNYFNKTDCNELFDDTFLYTFLLKLANIFNIKKVVIHQYNSFCKIFNDYNKYNIYGYNISLYKKDIYDYLANKKIRFKNISHVENTMIDNLTKLENIPIPDIIKRKTVYKSFKNMELKNNLKEFYLFINKYLCYQIPYYIKLMEDTFIKHSININLEYTYIIHIK